MLFRPLGAHWNEKSINNSFDESDSADTIDLLNQAVNLVFMG